MANSAEDLLLRIQGDSASGQQAVQQLADVMANSLAKALAQVKQSTEDSNQATSALKKYLDDLTPSTKNAHAAFSDLKGTLTDLWENPAQGASNFAKALASDLTPALGALGVAAGVAVGALAAIGAASHELAEQTARVGAALQDTSFKTGIAVPALSQWRGAIEIAGGSLEQFGNALFMMQRRMAEGGPEFQKGLDRIGVSMGELQGLQPDQQFLKMAEGIRALPDPAQRAAAAMEMFGRQGRELLPLIEKDLPELLKQSEALGSVWTEQDAQAAEQFEMASRGLSLQLENIRTVIGRDLIPLFTVSLTFAQGSIGWLLTSGPLSSGLRDLQTLSTVLNARPDVAAGLLLGGPLGALNAGLGNDAATMPGAPGAPAGFGADAGVDAAARQSEAIGRLQDHLQRLRDTIVPLTAEQQAQARTMLEGGDSAKVAAGYLGVAEEAVRKFDDTLKADQRATEQWNTAVGNLADILSSPNWDGSVASMLKLGGSVHDAAVYFGETEAAVRKVQEQLQTLGKIIKIEAGQPLEDFSTQLHKLGDAVPEKFFSDEAKMFDQLQLIESGAKVAATALESIGTKAKPSLDDLNAQLTRSQRSVISISDSLKTLPDLMIQAFTGGGNLSGAFQGLATQISAGLFGDKGPLSNITKDVTSGVGGALSGLFGKNVAGLLGGAVSSFLPGIGGLITQGIGALMNIGGPSQDELQARDAFKSIQQSGESLTQTIQRLSGELMQAGKTGPEALGMIQRALDATHTNAAAVNSALKDINGVLDQQKQDQADLQAAVTRYKFSIEELGPAMQKQQLDAQAQQLMNDWRLLVGSGIELSTVNEHMADSMNDYLKVAKTTGQEVPAAMEPIIQKMIDQGLLTDDAGQKITDMKDLGVSFSETMTQGFQHVVDKLQELIDNLGIVPKKIAEIPSSVNVQVNGVYNPPDMSGYWDPNQYPYGMGYGSVGGMVTPEGIQYFARGVAQVQRLSAWAARGSDTVPAMLTPGEAILTRSAAATLGRSAIASLNRGASLPSGLASGVSSAASAAGTIINNYIEGNVITERELYDRVGQHLADGYMQHRVLPLGR